MKFVFFFLLLSITVVVKDGGPAVATSHPATDFEGKFTPESVEDFYSHLFFLGDDIWGDENDSEEPYYDYNDTDDIDLTSARFLSDDTLSMAEEAYADFRDILEYYMTDRLMKRLDLARSVHADFAATLDRKAEALHDNSQDALAAMDLLMTQHINDALQGMDQIMDTLYDDEHADEQEEEHEELRRALLEMERRPFYYPPISQRYNPDVVRRFPRWNPFIPRDHHPDHHHEDHDHDGHVNSPRANNYHHGQNIPHHPDAHETLH